MPCYRRTVDSPQPLVSVLITAWNAQQYIAAAIDSVLQQTYTNFEVIVVDDGSTDKTSQIVSQFDSDKITLISLAGNRGIPAALNEGLRRCEGKYIARLDADDLCLPNRLAHQVAILEGAPEIGVLGGSALAITGDEKVLPSIQVRTDFNLGCRLLFGNQLKSSTVIIRHSVLRDNFILYNEVFPNAQDYELWCRLSQITRIANDATPVGVYRYHRSQQTSQNFERQLSLALRVQANALAHARQTRSCSRRTIAQAHLAYLKYRLLLSRVRLSRAPVPFVKRLAWSNMGDR